MINLLKQKALRTARQTALFLASGITALVGVGFLTASAWIYLETRYDSLLAALIIGLAYITLASVLLMLGRKESESIAVRELPTATGTPPAPSHDMGVLAPLASAFVFGLNAGLKVDEQRSA
jgi:hypothetical protein